MGNICTGYIYSTGLVLCNLYIQELPHLDTQHMDNLSVIQQRQLMDFLPMRLLDLCEMGTALPAKDSHGLKGHNHAGGPTCVCT